MTFQNLKKNCNKVPVRIVTAQGIANVNFVAPSKN